MNVGQAIAYALEWVDLHGHEIPGFCGAHLMGSILSLPYDAPFPAYRDVDLNVVVSEGPPADATHDVAYKGLMIEYGTVNVARYRVPEEVLANPELAANLAVDGILADPHCILTPLQRTVAAQYASRTWVRARCAYEQQVVAQCLEALCHVESPSEAVWPVLSGVLFLSGLLAVASLRAPTHRRSLVVMREVLAAQGRLDLYEAVLGLLGFAHMSRWQVELCLQDCALAFDCAVKVTRTPVPFHFKLQPHIRPYVVMGAREMIDQGFHREAMFWIAGFLMFANGAIQADAPDGEKPIFQAKLDRVRENMGFRTPADVMERRRTAEELASEVCAVADTILERRAA